MAFYRARSRSRSRNRKRRAVLFLCLFSLLVIALYVCFNIALMPVLKTAAVNKARMSAVNTINSAVGQVLKEDNISYDKLITFDKDSSGSITAVKSDTLQINILKYDITNEVIKELEKVGSSEIRIPFGTVMGGQIFTGRGPTLNVRYQPVGNINSQISNSFTAAGINQTRQQIMLTVTADITVMISSYNVSTQVSSNFCIADSVIVGSVPGSYTVVDGTDGTSDKVFIYGKNGSSSSSASSSGKK